jgi:hypothetical protein
LRKDKTENVSNFAPEKRVSTLFMSNRWLCLFMDLKTARIEQKIISLISKVWQNGKINSNFIATVLGQRFGFR